jgi:hypothetical protein
MKQLQKIAVGLLGFTHPEMFLPRRSANESAGIPIGREIADRWLQRGAQFVRASKFLWSALAIGSRTVPLADNSELVGELTARATGLYGSHRSYC